jgi:phage repressor protein C with HTH and peptisase S24 domain
VLQRRRALLAELPEPFNDWVDLTAEQTQQWLIYWQASAIDLWVEKKPTGKHVFFIKKNQQLYFNQNVSSTAKGALMILTQELLDYRYLQYEVQQVSKKGQAKPLALPFEAQQVIPYFPSLAIACGHFAASGDVNSALETKLLPLSYGRFDPAKFFLAHAKGHSMNGGKQPIEDGALLLLELIGTDNAGSNDGKIIAIERQDLTGDDQYVLRKVKKIGQGQYQLLAQNTDYPPLLANVEMRTFARLNQVLPQLMVPLHRAWMREDIPILFGLTFSTGSWREGHVCPIVSNEQFLLVTLNKEDHEIAASYYDDFESHAIFNWHSQTRTALKDKRGQGIIHHAAQGSHVHLFVRTDKLIYKGGTAAPLIYCGTVQYISHEGQKPMAVKWHLDVPLIDDLFHYFS